MSQTTPMMAQYLSIKAEHPDALLFYRMGDFYELFFDDAVAASDALSIALTKRGKHEGEDIPMCGVPVHSAEAYLLQLIRSGFRVAIAEQLEAPSEAKKRGAKSVVKRGVVRLVTPGTLTEDSLLRPDQSNWLAAYAQHQSQAALALVELSTGDLRSLSFADIQLGPELARFGPRELLASETAAEHVMERAEELGVVVTPRPVAEFRRAGFKAAIERHFLVQSAEAFGAFSTAEQSALTALLAYLELTQKEALASLSPPKREDPGKVMRIDPATRTSLELTKSLQNGGRSGSLLGTIDRTVTAFGARHLAEQIASPLLDIEALVHRHDAVQAFVEKPAAREALRAELKACPDMERALSRLSLGRGGPRDLGFIKAGLAAATKTESLLEAADFGEAQPISLRIAEMSRDLHSKLDDALSEALPMALTEGGLIANGWSETLDTARRLRDEGRAVIAEMQQRYASDTGIQSLKIKHNAVLGYHIEVTATHGPKMLDDPFSQQFRHRQTTANALRFTTDELENAQSAIQSASADAARLEAEFFEALRGQTVQASDEILTLVAQLAQLDVASALADLAAELRWTRPQLFEDHRFNIHAGRHPVVEAALRREGQTFMANDCDLGNGNMNLLTGPNMAGKSTFLRQNALIVILAQAGSFVPADHAEIGLVHSIWSRVGASDDLARGRSTFMVEMVETAAILNQADDRAFVILDEIGRGTATWDGLSIAWSALEHLLEVNECRGLFATHYHELTHLADNQPRLENATMAVSEHQGQVVFLHEVKRGTADRSYGVHVAELAGMPRAATVRAREILERLEAGDGEHGHSPAQAFDDLPLFAKAPKPSVPNEPSAVHNRLKSIDPDTLTPKEALNLIYELVSMSPNA